MKNKKVNINKIIIPFISDFTIKSVKKEGRQIVIEYESSPIKVSNIKLK